MFFYIILSLILSLIYFKIYMPHQYWKIRKVQFVKPTPIVGNMKEFLTGKKTATEVIVDVYNSFENARYIGTYMFLQPLLLIKDPKLIKQIFVKDFDSFVDRNYTAMSDDTEPLFGRCLFFLKGQKWKDMRSTLSPAFTSSKMRSVFTLISDCAKNLVNHFQQELNGNNFLITLEMKDVTSRFANDVIGSCAFGLNCDSVKERDNEFYRMGKRTSDLVKGSGLKFFGYLLSPTLMRYFNIKLFQEHDNNYYRNLVTSMMKYREKEAIVRPDMIHQLMEAKKGKLKYEESAMNSDGFAVAEEAEIERKRSEKTDFTDDDLIAQTVLFFAAGFETNSTLFSFMFYDLAVNEDVQRKLCQEVDETLETCKGELTYEIISNMKYLDMVVCESLRLWPPGLAVDRKCNKTYRISPENSNEETLVLEKGSVLWIPIYAIHMDPKYWPNPDKYDPERFNDENKKNILPFTFLPFGVGPRNCIGSRFALLAAKTLIVNILAKFEIVVVRKTQIPIKFPKKCFGMNAENGIWIGLKKKGLFFNHT